MATSLSNQGLPQLIITRILRDGHVTITQLEHRAHERGVLLSDLYAALDVVHRDKRIARGVSKGEVYYRPAATPKAPITYTLPPYPHTELGESPFKVCSCAQWHVHWENKMGHFPSCDAHHPDYPVQNPWDYTAGTMIDLELYEKVVQQEKAIRSRRTKGYHAVSPR